MSGIMLLTVDKETVQYIKYHVAKDIHDDGTAELNIQQLDQLKKYAKENGKKEMIPAIIAAKKCKTEKGKVIINFC